MTQTRPLAMICFVLSSFLLIACSGEGSNKKSGTTDDTVTNIDKTAEIDVRKEDQPESGNPLISEKDEPKPEEPKPEEPKPEEPKPEEPKPEEPKPEEPKPEEPKPEQTIPSELLGTWAKCKSDGVTKELIVLNFVANGKGAMATQIYNTAACPTTFTYKIIRTILENPDNLQVGLQPLLKFDFNVKTAGGVPYLDLDFGLESEIDEFFRGGRIQFIEGKLSFESICPAIHDGSSGSMLGLSECYASDGIYTKVK